METTFIDMSPDDTVKVKKKPRYQEMVYRLSVHGALDFYESHTWSMKLMWALVIISALILATIQIYLTFDTYMNSPILTSYAVVPKSQMDFPQVYICPMNSVNKNKLGKDRDNIKLFFGMMKSLDDQNSILSKINRNYDVIRTIGSSSPRTQIKMPTIMKVFKTISLNETDFVKECGFQRKFVDCKAIVRRTFDGDYGQCFLFTTNMTQKVPGYGLSLALDIRRDLYDSSLIPPFDGLLLHIMSKFDPGGSGEGILVKPGAWTKISLHARHYKLINAKTGRVKQICIDDSKIHDYQVLNTSGYSVSSCKIDCAQRASFNYCECVLPMEQEYLKESYYNSTCSFKSLHHCFYKIVMKNYTEEIANCSKQCVAKCEYWEYAKTISSVDLSEENLEQQEVVSNPCQDGNICNDINFTKPEITRAFKDTVILDVSFSELIYTEIVQSISMTVDTLLGNIGGQVGLWMGVSVISVIQVLMLGMCYCAENYCGRNTI